MIIIQSELTDEGLIRCILQAAKEYENLVDNTYLFIGKNKDSENYFYFECTFFKRNFMHLVGVDSKNMSAENFYNKCFNYNHGMGEKITIEDCHPAKGQLRKSMNEKASSAPYLFNIKLSKSHKLGIKCLPTENNQFKYGYGLQAILGIKFEDNYWIPSTLLPQSIDFYANKIHRVAFVCKKHYQEEYYTTIAAEIKPGLFKELFDTMPQKLKDKIKL